jgi:DNA-binding response OmpR family regulator
VVIDRDSGFLQVLSNRLHAQGFELRTASTALTPEALAAMRANALVIDPAIVGPRSRDYLEDVFAKLPGLAVIICTGASSVGQRVGGLRLGADAWVTKPCHPEELICVVEAVLRRGRRNEVPALKPSAVAGEISIRPDLHQAYRGELSVGLTARELEVLTLLVQSDRVLRREEIYGRVWRHEMPPGDRSVDVFMGKLRRKLRAASPGWRYVHTHFGVGYRFSAEYHGKPNGQTTGKVEMVHVADDSAGSSR